MDHVILGLACRDKAELIGELATRAAARLAGQPPDGRSPSDDTLVSRPEKPVTPGIPGRDDIQAALLARERMGSTGLGRGFALPHARMSGVSSLFGLFARLARPIEFDAIDGRPVDLVFLLLSPGVGRDHVATLAAVARAMRDPVTLEHVRKAGSAALVHRHLVTAAPAS